MSVPRILPDSACRFRLPVVVLTLWIFLVAACIPSRDAHAGNHAIAPTPGWVKQVEIPQRASGSNPQVQGGLDYVLVDGQTLLDARGRTTYRRIAVRPVNDTGLHDAARISVSFSPEYEVLSIHAIAVHRGGKTLSRLENAKVRILQRESSLEYRIYDGRKSAEILLDDVRVGDVVEYAYSIRGINPVFGRQLFGTFQLQSSVPVARLHARLLTAPDREVRFRLVNGAGPAEQSEFSGMREYRWLRDDVPALRIDTGAPSWFDPYPHVQWSEYRDWEAVVDWALPLYRLPDTPAAALRREVDRIAATSGSPRARMLDALRFVQGEIRYLGIEVGASSHRPSAPETVLRQRFGDCKDKSLLLVAMLRALGIDAVPALVHTENLHKSMDMLPSPGAFDHVIVRARLDGKTWWLDPTLSRQDENIELLFEPDYGAALPIEQGVRALERVRTSAEASMARRTIHVVIDARNGIGKPASMEVLGTYRQRAADQMRGTFAGRSRDDLQKSYLDFYARHFPGIRLQSTFTVEDDRASNTIVTREQYVIPEFWKRSDEKKRFEAEVYAADIDEFLRHPGAATRAAPLAIRHPVDVTLTTEIQLHEPWNTKPSLTTVDGKAFRFTRKMEEMNSTLVITDQMTSLADHVMPADMVRHVSEIEKARGALGYSLYRHDIGPDADANANAGFSDRFNWPVAILGMFMSAFWIWLALRLFRYDPAPQAALPDSPSGFGGWLLLPVIGMLATPFVTAAHFWGTLPAYATHNWAALTLPGGAAYHPAWSPLLLAELCINTAILVLTILLSVLFFRKRSSLPRMYLALGILLLALTCVDLALAVTLIPEKMSINDDDRRLVIQQVISLLVWGPYFLRSQRVRATFVKRHPHASTLDKRDTATQPAPVSAQ